MRPQASVSQQSLAHLRHQREAEGLEKGKMAAAPVSSMEVSKSLCPAINTRTRCDILTNAEISLIFFSMATLDILQPSRCIYIYSGPDSSAECLSPHNTGILCCGLRLEAGTELAFRHQQEGGSTTAGKRAHLSAPKVREEVRILKGPAITSTLPGPRGEQSY